MPSPLAALFERGIWIECDGRALRVGPRHLLTDDARAFIAAHRDAILAELEAHRLDETTRNILALSPAELETYRRELAEASADDPWRVHDAEALARAEAAMRAAPRHHAIPATCQRAATCARSGPCRGFLTGGACTPAKRPRPDKEAA